MGEIRTFVPMAVYIIYVIYIERTLLENVAARSTRRNYTIDFNGCIRRYQSINLMHMIRFYLVLRRKKRCKEIYKKESRIFLYNCDYPNYDLNIENRTV